MYRSLGPQLKHRNNLVGDLDKLIYLLFGLLRGKQLLVLLPCQILLALPVRNLLEQLHRDAMCLMDMREPLRVSGEIFSN